MEQYGRPAAKKRTPHVPPPVAFLHPASSKPSTKDVPEVQRGMMPSLRSKPKRNQESESHDQRPEMSARRLGSDGQSLTPRHDSPVAVHKVRPSTASAVKSSSLQFSNAAPQTDSDAPATSVVPALKLRPRTASYIKSMSLGNNDDTPTPPTASLTERRLLADDATPDSAYIALLKEDIKRVHQLLSTDESRTQSSRLLQQRDTLAVPDRICHELAKHNYSTSDGQVVLAKKALERLLSDSLIALMDKTLVDEAKMGGSINQDETSGGGAGMDAGSVYFNSFMTLSRRAEMLKKRVVADSAEKDYLRDQLHVMETRLGEANDELVVFKDTFQKIASERGVGHGWALLRSEVKRGTFSTNDDKQKDERCAALEAQLAELQSTLDQLSQDKADMVVANESLADELRESRALASALDARIESTASATSASMLAMQSQVFALGLASAHGVQLDKAMAHNHDLDRELQAAKAALKKTQADAKATLTEAATTLKTKVEAAHESGRQLLARTQAEWEAKAGDAAQAHEAQLHKADVVHARALTALEGEKARLTDELAAARRQNERDLSCARDAAESQQAAAVGAWTEKLEGKTKALEAAQRQVADHEATILQLKLVVSEQKVTERHEMETAWLTKIAALEAALAQASAKLEAERDKSALALRTEADRVRHVMTQAKSVADELETANLCLAERKRQRDSETQAFEDRERRAAAAIAELTAQVTRLRRDEETNASGNIDLETECRQLHKHNDELVKQMEKMKEKHDVTVSELQLLLQDARNKANEAALALGLLEANKVDLLNKLAVSDASVRQLQRQLTAAKDESQQLEMAAIEQRMQQESRLNERLVVEKRVLQKQQLDMDAETQTLMEEKQLLQTVVRSLNERLGLQLELLASVPKDEKTNKDAWAAAHAAWQRIQERCDDADWQLMHMKARLDEMDTPKVTRARKQAPFSDAIAAGQRAAAVVDQLQNESDSYAAALAKEMQLMKATYEGKLSEATSELKRVQNMRSDHTVTLEEEKLRYLAMINQLQGRCAALEDALAKHMTAKRAEKDEEVDLICKYRVERDTKTKAGYLEALLEARAKACSDEVRRRTEFEESQRASTLRRTDHEDRQRQARLTR
ncbi:Aste57867_447 [Aphanomyces stellatus]|uniref:Aste57867_447 protein n=1 Tax=Aphanomyces stellatus TaxID=120398 RepID=A0A485K2N6_9STRA|nr:hypothetical protein As57867_000446 [Aphanomyces stellatus]VFT77672.1 Aste57867_447 [Aphanomyces stellatus]